MSWKPKGDVGEVDKCGEGQTKNDRAQHVAAARGSSSSSSSSGVERGGDDERRGSMSTATYVLVASCVRDGSAEITMFLLR